MNRDILVKFNPSGIGARYLPSRLKDQDVPKDALINPDLSQVKGLSPSFWALNLKGEIVPCSHEERIIQTDNQAINHPHFETKVGPKFLELTNSIVPQIDELSSHYGQLLESRQRICKTLFKQDKDISKMSRNITLLRILVFIIVISNLAVILLLGGHHVFLR